MSILIEVIQDLFYFVFVELFGWRPSATGLQSGKNSFAVAVASPIVTPLKDKSKLLPPGADRATPNALGTVSVAAQTAHLFLLPVASFDSVIADIPYGTMLNVYQSQNRWYQVEYRGHLGWILKDAATTDNIYPQFRLGQYYDSKDIETIKLRSFIHDEFNGGLIEVPLQDVEYVTYRLRLRGKLLPWSETRPRVSGNWKQLLRGALGVHIAVSPKNDSVMEVADENGEGRVSYVEAVFPDESIIVSEVGFPEEGMYSERTLPKEEWREFRPVFITVN